MKPADNVKQFVKDATVSTRPDGDAKVLSAMLAAYDQTQNQSPAAAQTAPAGFWRLIMKSKLTKFAAAAAILIVIGVVLRHQNLSIDGASPAYALDQTIQASHSIRYIHVKNSFSGYDEPFEGWYEFDEAGNVKIARILMPAWGSPDDGTITVVWKDDKAHFWIKKKNIYAIMKDNMMAEMVRKTAERLDPKTALQNLQQLESDNKITLDIEQPEDKAGLIVVTAAILETASENASAENTSSIDREMKKMLGKFMGADIDISKIILFIDPATRLVTTIEFYEHKEDGDHFVNRLEYYDYNQPIDAKMFNLEDEVPADALRIDQANNKPGLTQGNLTDDEIAVELIRQFLQALIDRDYAKAGQMWGGVPAERMEKTYGHIRFIRIISIGKPVSNAMTHGLFVPCTIEIEEDGKITQWQPEHSYVRQVYGQPGRWEIIGGFRGI